MGSDSRFLGIDIVGAIVPFGKRVSLFGIYGYAFGTWFDVSSP